MRAKPRPAKVVAAGWLIAAVGLTVLVAPVLGWRGWLWLGVFDLLSLLGAGWELWLREPPRRWYSPGDSLSEGTDGHS